MMEPMHKSNVFSKMTEGDYEQIVFVQQRSSRLRAIIAIHSLRRGPALGGCRFYPFPNEESALMDAMRLAQGMTYKAALADLPLGGGKSVILGDPSKDRTEALFLGFGRAVERLGGAYISAEDVGTSPADMDIVRKVTKHVVGVSSAEGGVGDPSPITAQGVVEGIRACVNMLTGSPDLKNKRIAIQGVGHVGLSLARQLRAQGASLIVTDTNGKNAKIASEELGAKVVSKDEIFSVECDVFAPCALGAILNEDTIKKLRCFIVAGAANNQLSTEDMGQQLLARNILYAPDFAINAGGLIYVAQEVVPGFDQKKAQDKVKNIYNTIATILQRSKEQKIPTSQVAIAMAKERLDMV